MKFANEISKNIKSHTEMAMRDGKENVCFYCGKETDEIDIDHITPQKLGGINHPMNYAVSCAHCNRSKNGMHPLLWISKWSTKVEEIPNEVLAEYIGRVGFHQIAVK